MPTLTRSFPQRSFDRAPFCRRPARFIASVVALVAGGLAVGTASSAAPGATTRTPSPASASPGGVGQSPSSVDGRTTAFTDVLPCRLLDTREAGAVAADSTIEVRVAGRCGVATGATAAAVTITAVSPAHAGFVTAWGDGDQPASSNVNFGTGQTVANSTIVPIGDDGRIRVFADADTHVLVDVSGAFVAADAPRAGRFRAIEPDRILDTRLSGDTMSPDDTVTVALPDGVPSDARGIAATVTVVGAQHDGYVTAHPAGTEPPDTSIANLVAGSTHAASAILPVSSDGLSITTTTGGDLIVDVTGWFTGTSASRSSDGLFVPVEPVRLHDSRFEKWTLGADGTREISVPDGAAWAINLTGTNVRADGFVTALPARTERPTTSVLNTVAGDSRSNSAVVAVSDSGLAAYTSSPLDIVVDGFGWFTGSPTPETTAAAPDIYAERRVLVIGDSAAAGMRWNGTTHALLGAEFTPDLESCRRLVAPSCQGRHGYTPRTVHSVIDNSPYGRYDTLVVATGYNDSSARFADDFDTITTAARAKGMRSILWVTYREGVGYSRPGGYTSYVEMNQVLRDKVTAPHNSDVEILDWWAYTTDAPGWFAGDGVHQNTSGSYGMADFLSRAVAALDDRRCPMPWEPGGDPETPCPDPTPLPGERGGVPDVITLYSD